MMSWKLKLPLTALLLGGCATVKEADPADSVRQAANRQFNLKIQPQANRRMQIALSDLPLSPDVAVRYALMNNHELAARLDELKISQADLVQSGLIKNPVLDLSVRLPDRSPRKAYLDFGVSESLFDLLMVGPRKRLANADLAAAQERVTAAVFELIVHTKQAYFRALAAQQIVSLQQQHAKAAEAADAFAKRLLDAGNIPPLHALQAHSAEATAHLNLIAAERDCEEECEKLAVLMGVDRNPLTPGQELPALAEMQVPSFDLATVVTHRPDIQAAASEVRRAGMLLGIMTDTRFFNDLMIGAEAERETEGQWRVGPTIQIPLPLFDQGQATIARRKAELEQAANQYAAQVASARSQVRVAEKVLSDAHAQAALYASDILPTQQQIVDQTLLNYNGMFIGTGELLSAQSEQLETQIKAVAALRDYWVAVAEFEGALGGRIVTRPSAPTTQAVPTTTESDGQMHDMKM